MYLLMTCITCVLPGTSLKHTTVCASDMVHTHVCVYVFSRACIILTSGHFIYSFTVENM